MITTKIAVVTAAAARDLDEDLPPLVAALDEAGIAHDIVNWHDAHIDWTRYALAVLRSTWDYTTRLHEFLAWAERTAQATTLLNPLDVLRWNTDKHYLGDLARAGVASVASHFIEPGEDASILLDRFLHKHAAGEFVVKPSVGAGSRDAQRYSREEHSTALAHAQRLLDAGRSVLLQPYLERVDEHGETAAIFFDGVFSHAIRKGPLLRRGGGPTRALFAAEHIMPRTPTADELRVAESALAAIPIKDSTAEGRQPMTLVGETGVGGADHPAAAGVRAGAQSRPREKPLLYARVDLIRDGADRPCVLELELTEPSLFFAHAKGATQRYVAAIARRLP